MADPITGLAALSLVCNVVELVSFTAKILSRVREIQSSAKGELEAHSVIKTCAAQLAKLNEPLKSPWGGHEAKGRQLPLDDDEKALEKIAVLCHGEAQSLIVKLDKLKVGGGVGWRKSVAHVVKAWVQEEEVEGLEKRMKSYQDAMNSISIRSAR